MISDVGTSANLDVGTGANQLVQLDANARLPAVDGSQLTNISSGETNTPYFSAQEQALIKLYPIIRTQHYNSIH